MNYVLKLCGWYPSRVDNLSGDFVQRQAIAISKQCKTVVLFAQKDPGLSGWKIETDFTKNGALYEYRFYYPKKRWLDKFWSQWYYLRILKNFLPGLVAEHGAPTLVHVNVVWKAAIWAQYLFSKYRWPFVITEHSTEYQPEAIDNIRDKSASRQIITRRTFSNCLLLLPVSNHLAKTIQELYGLITCQVIPNVVDTSLFYYEPKPANNKVVRIVHISTMGYQKNIEGIIRVLGRLTAIATPFEVVLAGPASDKIRQLVAAEENLPGKVSFTGSISYSEVADLLRTADYLLQFSRYENLPCVILEALCTGVPVITSNVGGISEMVTPENGVLVPREDEDALLEALSNVLEGRIYFDNELISKKASALYNYEVIGSHFLDAYKAVLGLGHVSEV